MVLCLVSKERLLVLLLLLLLLLLSTVGGRPIKMGRIPSTGVVTSGLINDLRPAGAVEGCLVFFEVVFDLMFVFLFVFFFLLLRRCSRLGLRSLCRCRVFFPFLRRRPRTLPPALLCFPGSIGSTKSIKLGIDT